MRSLGRLALLLLLCLAAGELAARIFWSTAFGVPVLAPDRILYAWYPGLRRIDRKEPRRGDDRYDVLLLGGSVLHPDWGVVPRELRRQLGAAGIASPRIFNLAAAAHTSRDSLLKYRAAEKERFDLVILYHGINETRANNAPPDVFRADYSHYQWYETVNLLAPHHGRSRLALPYTLAYAALRMRQLLQAERYVPMHRPRDEWLEYGSEIRTAESFRSNVSEIARLAGERGDPLVLASFAIHVPEDYSLAAFREGRLDYRLHSAAVNGWGIPRNVVAGVEAHNRALAEVARSAPGALFVDPARLLPRGGRWFDDVCHLTPEGAALLAKRVVDAALDRWPVREGLQRPAGAP